MFYAGHVGAIGQPLNAVSASGPSFTTDFTPGSAPAGFSFARASAANYFNSSGVRTAAANDMPRYDYNPQTLQPRGMLLEESRTNFFLNSLAPVNQTITLGVGTYVLWIEGSGSVLAVAGTAVGSFGAAATNSQGLGMYGEYDVITVTTAGTVLFTITATVTAVQVEGGAFPTTMITTAGAAATRGVERSDITPIPWYNQAEGTLIVEWIHPNLNNTAANIVAAYGAAEIDRIQISRGSTSGVAVTSGGSVSLSASFANVAYTVCKLAVAYKINDFAASYNGSTPTVSTSGNVPVNVSFIALGHRFLGNTQLMNGWLRKVTYYPTRLPDAQLQALTS